MNSPQIDCQSNPLAAKYYADSAKRYEVTILENQQLARDTYRVRFHCPELAESITPGQFLMLRLADCDDPLLGRPFALYDTILDVQGKPIGVDVVYLVLGKMTSRLAQATEGESLQVWGPLGNGFSAKPVDHLIMVAGWYWPDAIFGIRARVPGRTKLREASSPNCSLKASFLVLRCSFRRFISWRRGFSSSRYRSKN